MLTENSNVIRASPTDKMPTPDDSSCETEQFRPQVCDPNHKWELVWKRVLTMVIFQLFGVYGACLLFTSAKLLTGLFALFLHVCAMVSITAGSHRLWSHKAFKANMPLRVLIMLVNSMAAQGTILWWARDHRVHHKYTDTDADPYNSSRGFFFSHIGWLMVKKHPDVITASKRIDMADLYADPVVDFQRKYYIAVMLPVFWILLPMLIPYHFWGETLTNGFFVCVMLRWTCTMQATFLINSVAHMWGYKPYEKTIGPAENAAVTFFTLGEGWHNYHHVFPSDYRAAELGRYSTTLTTNFIDLMAKIGWASDLKSQSRDVVIARLRRTGDGSW